SPCVPRLPKRKLHQPLCEIAVDSHFLKSRVLAERIPFPTCPQVGKDDAVIGVVHAINLLRFSSATNDSFSLIASGVRPAAPAPSISGKARRSAGHPYK